MRDRAPTDHSSLAALAWLAAGVGLLVLAWALPVNLKSITPALLRAAGTGTPSVAELGKELVQSEKIGPAALALAAADAVRDPRAPELKTALAQLAAHQPEMVAWGGWDPFLDPLFNLHENKGRAASTPVLVFFIAGQARESLRAYLANSRSLGVQAVLRTRELTDTGRFVPVAHAGGQPLDAVILLTALLYQGEHFSPSLQREVRTLAETAAQQKSLGELEAFYLDMLSLGRRLDWIQLSELLRHTDDSKTVGEYAQLARVTPEELPLIYTAALLSNSADRVATYLLQYGKAGLEDLRLALGLGQGAVRQLLLRQVPVNRAAVLGGGVAADFALLHPILALIAKYLGYFLGAFLILRGCDRWVVAPLRRATSLAGTHSPLRAQSSALALLVACVIVITTEPFLLKAAPPSEYRFKLVIPVLANAAAPSPTAPSSTSNHSTMDTSTVVSIGIFALLQVATYLFCLRKISEIDRQDTTPQLKMRLLENEENLFDSGLYVGMIGTATALVMQVLGVIEPNLLAAYSSNLFGIVCVAFVKIRHVRGYKRRLILASQGGSGPVPVLPSLVATP